MKLKKAESSTPKRAKSEEMVKQGKRSKRKGNNYERTIAKAFQSKYGVELKRTPQSGGFSKKSDKADDFRGDVTIVDNTLMLLLHIEAKDQKTWALPKWLRQAEEDCPDGRTPVVIMHQYNSSKDYVCLRLEDFLNLVPKDKVITRRKFK